MLRSFSFDWALNTCSFNCWHPLNKIYFYVHQDIFTLFMVALSFQSRMRPNISQTEIMSRSLSWTLSLELSELQRFVKKRDLMFSFPILEIHSHKDESLFSSRLRRCSHQMRALCLSEPQRLPFISENVCERSLIHWGPDGDERGYSSMTTLTVLKNTFCLPLWS